MIEYALGKVLMYTRNICSTSSLSWGFVLYDRIMDKINTELKKLGVYGFDEDLLEDISEWPEYLHLDRKFT